MENRETEDQPSRCPAFSVAEWLESRSHSCCLKTLSLASSPGMASQGSCSLLSSTEIDALLSLSSSLFLLSLLPPSSSNSLTPGPGQVQTMVILDAGCTWGGHLPSFRLELTHIWTDDLQGPRVGHRVGGGQAQRGSIGPRQRVGKDLRWSLKLMDSKHLVTSSEPVSALLEPIS